MTRFKIRRSIPFLSSRNQMVVGTPWPVIAYLTDIATLSCVIAGALRVQIGIGVDSPSLNPHHTLDVIA